MEYNDSTTGEANEELAKRLAKDRSDKDGLLLLEFASKVNPKDDNTLLTQAKLREGFEIKTVKTSLTEQKYFEVLASIASKELNKDPIQAALYFSICKHFVPKNEKVLLGTMKLEMDRRY